jgi:hypothetical protein
MEYVIHGDKVKMPLSLVGKLSKPKSIEVIEDYKWNHKLSCLDFTSCGEEFAYIFQTSGIKQKDAKDKKVALLCLDALVKYKNLKKSKSYIEKVRTEEDALKYKEHIRTQLARRFKKLSKPSLLKYNDTIDSSSFGYSK